MYCDILFSLASYWKVAAMYDMLNFLATALQRSELLLHLAFTRLMYLNTTRDSDLLLIRLFKIFLTLRRVLLICIYLFTCCCCCCRCGVMGIDVSGYIITSYATFVWQPCRCLNHINFGASLH